MTRGPEMSSEMRAKVEVLRASGFTLTEIAKKLHISVSSAYRTLKRIADLGCYSSRKRTGRPRKTDTRGDRMIARIIKLSPKCSSSSVRARLPVSVRNVSTRTIRRRLFDGGLKSYAPARKPRLTPKNIKDRIRFCKQYRNWTPQQWERVMFTDESTFTQFHNYCQHVRRPAGKRFDSKYVIPVVKMAPKVMVWGSVSAYGRGALWFLPPKTSMTGPVYLQVIQEKLPQFMEIHGTTYFQQDGAPCHGVRPVREWLEETGYTLVGHWPGNSPDLNIIENVWMKLKQKVAERHPTSMDDLVQKIKDAWVSDVTPDYCRTLAHSMPRRIANVLKNKGHHTKY